MKKISLLCFLFFSFTAFAQYGKNSVGVNAVQYIEIEANANGSLDVTNGFTFEAWILNFGGASNQKVAGKLVADFKNGFIFGIQDLQVNFEVFDDNGLNTSLLAGTISDIGWTHVAGTYEIGGMIAIYINGEKVGSAPASNVAINPNTNPFRIGIAPWDVNALGFQGYLDEVRYWQAVLEEETIKEWMHKDLTDAHVNYANLGFYHKYNETEGPVAVDESANANSGTFSNEEIVLEDQSLPFKGTFDLFENDVQGVWNAKPQATSDIMTIDGTFFDSLELANSVLLSNSDGDYSFLTIAPIDYDRSLAKTWRVANQGELFSTITFDLSPIDMSQVTDVVLLVSSDEDFADSDVVEGTLDGNSFLIEEEIFIDGYYYTLGFKTTITSTSQTSKEAYQINVSPNPNQGTFNVQIDQASAESLQISILNMTGSRVYQKNMEQPSSSLWETIKLNHLASGLYLLEVQGRDQISTKKVIIE